MLIFLNVILCRPIRNRTGNPLIMATQSAASKTFEATQFKPTPNNLEAFFMPFTSNRAFKAKPRLFVKAEGMHYTPSKAARCSTPRRASGA